MEPTEKTGNENPQPAPPVVGSAVPAQEGKLGGLFSKGLSEKKVRKIAREEAEKILNENMAFFRKMIVATPKAPETQIVSKEFRGSNPHEMEQQEANWLKKVGALTIDHVNDEKDPMSNFGRIKTVYAVVPKIQDIEDEYEKE
jgi:hypothetical protein